MIHVQRNLCAINNYIIGLGRTTFLCNRCYMTYELLMSSILNFFTLSMNHSTISGL